MSRLVKQPRGLSHDRQMLRRRGSERVLLSPPSRVLCSPPSRVGLRSLRSGGRRRRAERGPSRASDTLDFFTYWLAVLREMAVGGGQRKERNYVSDVKRSSLEKSRPFFIIICWLKLNAIKFVICIFFFAKLDDFKGLIGERKGG